MTPDLDALLKDYRNQKSPDPFDAWIRRDVAEYLDDPKIPLEMRWRMIGELNRVSAWAGIYAWFLRRLEPLLTRCSGETGVVKVCDVGSGAGGLLEKIHRLAALSGVRVELHAIDYREDAALRMKTRLADKNIPVTIHPGNACKLDNIGDGAFDIVVSTNMVHHLGNASQVAAYFAEMQRISRAGALILDVDRSPFSLVYYSAGVLIGAPWRLSRDGFRSARRAYKKDEIRFILDAAFPNPAKPIRIESSAVHPAWAVRIGF